MLCSVHCLVSLALGWVRFWPAVSAAHVGCEDVQSRLPFVVRPPSDVLHLLLKVRLFGHSLLAPPATPVCCALVGSLMRHSVTLVYCCALSFCCFSPGFLPLAFVQAWVGRLQSCLGSSLLFFFFFFFFGGGGGSPSFVLVVFAWRFPLFCCPSSLSFLNSCWGSFLSLPVFAVNSG